MLCCHLYCRRTVVDLPEFARSEGEARAEAIRGSHKEGESIVGPIKLVNNVPNSPLEYETGYGGQRTI
jgi:hypothetical protein